MLKFIIKKKNSGYTLIETMIAVALFIIIVTFSMTTLLNAGLLHKKSQSFRSIADSLNYTLDDMSRNLRTGYNYHCIESSLDLPILYQPKSGRYCLGVAFESQNGDPANNNDQWVYYIGPETSGTGVIGIWKSTDSFQSYVKLNPDEVSIYWTGSNFYFSVLGAMPPPSTSASCATVSWLTNDCQQPFAIIRLVGKIVLPNNVTTPFSLQTSASQRKIDI